MITFNNIVSKFEEFCTDHFFIKTFSYGSPADVDLDKLLKFHRSHGKLATVTAVRPTARFGHLVFDGDAEYRFKLFTVSREGVMKG